MKRRRATESRWLFWVKTSEPRCTIESSGYCDPELGDFLRVLMTHSRSLTQTEKDCLFTIREALLQRARQ